MTKREYSLSRWLREKKKEFFVFWAVSVVDDAAETNVRHITDFQTPGSKFCCVAAATLPHHVSYRHHSSRDVTSQYFPMKAAVA